MPRGNSEGENRPLDERIEDYIAPIIVRFFSDYLMPGLEYCDRHDTQLSGGMLLGCLTVIAGALGLVYSPEESRVSVPILSKICFSLGMCMAGGSLTLRIMSCMHSFLMEDPDLQQAMHVHQAIRRVRSGPSHDHTQAQPSLPKTNTVVPTL